MAPQVTKAQFRALYQTYLKEMPWWEANGQTFMAGVDRMLAGAQNVDIRGPIIQRVWRELNLPGKPRFVVLHALPD